MLPSGTGPGIKQKKSLRARSGRGNPHASKQGKYGLLRRRNFKFLLLAMTECLC